MLLTVPRQSRLVHATVGGVSSACSTFSSPHASSFRGTSSMAALLSCLPDSLPFRTFPPACEPHSGWPCPVRRCVTQHRAPRLGCASSSLRPSPEQLDQNLGLGWAAVIFPNATEESSLQPAWRPTGSCRAPIQSA